MACCCYCTRISKKLDDIKFIPEIGITKEKWEVHAVFIPEEEVDFEKECKRLSKIMDKHDCVNIFLSEGAATDIIIKESEKNGENILRDAYGHVRLDDLNPEFGLPSN